MYTYSSSNIPSQLNNLVKYFLLISINHHSINYYKSKNTRLYTISRKFKMPF
ncbi:hypothetical protein EVA_11712 [gut metagenome]|uniref:Uncharacterized protein n=1 Tax=gut metagenome TaxID=749906 RepID=J9CJE6_9ZZZZ